MRKLLLIAVALAVLGPLALDAQKRLFLRSTIGAIGSLPQAALDWTIPVTQPAAPSEASLPAGGCFTNEFGQRVCRVTTVAENCLHEYPDRSANNLDDSLMLLTCGAPKIINLAGPDKSRSGGMYSLPPASGIGSYTSYGMMWDPTMRNRLWWVASTWMGYIDLPIPYSGTGATMVPVLNLTTLFDLNAFPFTLLGPTDIRPWDDIDTNELYAHIMGISTTGRIVIDIKERAKRVLGNVQATFNYQTGVLTIVRADQGVHNVPSPSFEAGNLKKYIGLNQGQGRKLDYLTPMFDCWLSSEFKPPPNQDTRYDDPECVNGQTRNYSVPWGSSVFGPGNSVSGTNLQVHSATLDNTQVRIVSDPAPELESSLWGVISVATGWVESRPTRAYTWTYSDLSGAPLGAEENKQLPYVHRFFWPSESAMEGAHVSCNSVVTNTCVASIYHQNQADPIHATHRYAHLIFAIEPNAVMTYDAGLKTASNGPPGSSRRLAWGWTFAASLDRYWTTTRATQSLSGKYATFGSKNCRNPSECAVVNPNEGQAVWTVSVQ